MPTYVGLPGVIPSKGYVYGKSCLYMYMGIMCAYMFAVSHTYHGVCVWEVTPVQGGEDSYDALSRRSFLQKSHSLLGSFAENDL